MKKIAISIISLLLAFGLGAATAMAGNMIKVYVNGYQIAAQPYFELKNGKVVGPVREIAEALNAEVKWDGASGSVYINSGDEAGILANQIYHLERGFDLSTPEKTAELYAKAIHTRNGALFLVVVTSQIGQKYYSYLRPNFVPGVSSPWMDSYELGECTENKDGTVSAEISFVWKTSDSEDVSEFAIVMQKQDDGRWLIISDVTPY